jgi:hypothetical protein
MPEGPLGGYAPFERVTRVQAVRDFVDWLYEQGPTAEMPREKLLERYWNRVASEALQSAANGATQRMDERLDEAIATVVPFRPRP